mmetsp:Transcript_26819/g.81169  ORF Transcript_26819/g.81169 Transcript_26819/m.81169 type:complete len:91 (-) Transcript_26819:653-925(-)
MVRLPTRLAAQPTGSCMLTPHPAPCIANVLYIFLPFGLATLGLVGLVGFGMFLQLLVDKVGLLAAVLTHAGADAVVVLGLTDAIFNYLRR